MGKMLAAIFSVLFVFTISHADIYKYTDEGGIVCYTDTPFTKRADKVIKEKSATSPSLIRSSSPRLQNSAHYTEIVHEKAALYDLDPSLIKAVIKIESNWDCRAVSRKGAMGLMQLMPSTAVEMNVRDPFDPEENIEGGVKYLKYLLERFQGDLTLALAAYNAGPKTVEKFGYIPPIAETKQYVSKVLSLYSGKQMYAENNPADNKKSEPIYKVVLEDGTVLFTNSSLLARNPVRF
ncbi:MAG: transglycosylase SLT domain-containing protein [Nitrospirota bacterium]